MLRTEQSARALLVSSKQQSSLEEVTLDGLRQHFFGFLSRNHKGSERFMRRFWRLACRWKTIMGRPGFDEDADSGLDTDEAKSQLFDDFMLQVERWQHKFRQIGLDSDGRQVQDPMVTSLIENWKIDVRKTEPAEDIELAFKVAPDNNKASLVDHWVKEMYLRRLNAYWMLLDDKKVCSVINFLGAESVRFIRCLSVHVTAQHLETYEDLFDRVVTRRYQFLGRQVSVAESTFDAVCTDVGEDDEQLELQVWDAVAPDNPQEQQWRYERLLFPPPQKVEIEFYWCGVRGLCSHSKIEVISALSVCDEKSGMFKPIVSRALFQHHWNYCHNFFLLDRTLDLVSLGCLFLIVFMSKESNCSSPPDPQNDVPACLDQAAQSDRDARISSLMWIVAVINLFMLFQVVCEAALAVGRNVRTWFTSYNLFLVGMELYTLRLLWSLLGIVPQFAAEQTTTLAPGAVATSIFAVTLKTRPMLFCALILFKWGQFLLGYLVFDIGKTVLPAVYAMKSGESIKFVIYMVLAILACTHAYWSLPLEPGDYEATGQFGSATVSFFRMFRLCVMGDFDIWELEGIDGALDDQGYVDEPPEAWTRDNSTGVLGKSYYFHEDIRMIIMAFGTILTIMLMNMYIGVLSLAYESFLAVKLEVFSHAKSKFMLRYLLRRRAWRKVAKLILGDDALEDDTMPRILQIEAENPHEQMMALLDQGNLDEDGNASPLPNGWEEIILVDRQHWVGFWTTVPTNLMPMEETEAMYQNMEDNQGQMTDKLDGIETTVAGISEMVDILLRAQRGA